MNNIERHRRERGLTQTELAAMCRVGQGMISSYENGRIPTLPIALRIAKALGVSIDTLWPEESLNSGTAA